MDLPTNFDSWEKKHSSQEWLRFLDWTTEGWGFHYWGEDFVGTGGERIWRFCFCLLKCEISIRYLGEDVKWLVTNI